MVIILNFGTLVNFKAHTGKDIDDLVFDQRDGVQTAVGAHLGGHGDVHGLGGVAGSQRGLLDLRRQSLILCLGPLLELIDALADGGAFFLGNIAQGLGQPGDLAVFAQKLLPEFRKLGLVCHSGARLLDGGAQFLDFFFHSTPRFLRWGQGQNKKDPVPAVYQGRSLVIQNSAVPPVFRMKCGTLCLPITVQHRCALPGFAAFPAHHSKVNFRIPCLQAAFSR